MTKSKFYLQGFADGKDAAQGTDWQDGEMVKAYNDDTLGEIVGQILENWQQTADTIYYMDVSETNLERFEAGFYDGFARSVKDQLKALRKQDPYFDVELDISEDDLKLDHIPDITECRQIRKQFAKDQWRPNVWHINERGNTDLLAIGHNGAKIIKSWV